MPQKWGNETFYSGKYEQGFKTGVSLLMGLSSGDHMDVISAMKAAFKS